MRVISFCYICFLNIIYSFLKLLPQNKHKVLLMSRQSDKPSVDFKLLIEEIESRGDYKVVVLCKRIEENLASVFKGEFFYIYKQMYHLATSKYVVIDGYNIPVSVLKHKKNIRIIQIWHALGAIKKFGHQAKKIEEREKRADVFKMHRGYSAILSPSDAMTTIYEKGFNYPKSAFFTGLLPRVDYLLKEQKHIKSRFYKKYPKLKHQKIILYVPTFRNHNNLNLSEVAMGIPDGYILVPKLHKKTSKNSLIANSDKVTNIPDFNASQLLAVCDAIITDYSAITFEAMVLNIPLYFYIFDINSYEKYPGLNIDFRDYLKEDCFTDINKLYHAIKSQKYNFKNYDKCKAKFLGAKITKDNTKKLVDHILGENL